MHEKKIYSGSKTPEPTNPTALVPPPFSPPKFVPAAPSRPSAPKSLAAGLDYDFARGVGLTPGHEVPASVVQSVIQAADRGDRGMGGVEPRFGCVDGEFIVFSR